MDETFNGFLVGGFKMVFVFETGISSSELSSESEGCWFLLLAPENLFPVVFEVTAVTLAMDFLEAEISSELSSEDELLFYKLS